MHETLTTIWDGVLRQFPLIPDLWQPSPPQDGLLLPINGYKQTQSYTCGAVSGFGVAEYFRPALHFDLAAKVGRGLPQVGHHGFGTAKDDVPGLDHRPGGRFAGPGSYLDRPRRGPNTFKTPRSQYRFELLGQVGFCPAVIRLGPDRHRFERGG